MKPILEENQSYTFSDYFKLPYSVPNNLEDLFAVLLGVLDGGAA